MKWADRKRESDFPSDFYRPLPFPLWIQQFFELKDLIRSQFSSLAPLPSFVGIKFSLRRYWENAIDTKSTYDNWIGFAEIFLGGFFERTEFVCDLLLVFQPSSKVWRTFTLRAIWKKLTLKWDSSGWNRQFSVNKRGQILGFVNISGVCLYRELRMIQK